MPSRSSSADSRFDTVEMATPVSRAAPDKLQLSTILAKMA
jgi:hypothetical protein